MNKSVMNNNWSCTTSWSYTTSYRIQKVNNNLITTDGKPAESKPATSKSSRGEGQSRRYSRRKDTARAGAKTENI